MGDLKVKNEKEKEKETKSNKSVIKACLIFLIVVFIIFMVARYLTDEEFRGAFDTYILKKQLTESNLSTIEINSDTNPYIYAYDKYITVLNKNTLSAYTSDGSVYSEFDVTISVPLVSSNGKYMVLAELDGQKVYLISGSNIIWQNDIEGNISRVSVNKNGYVSIVVTNTAYKSVIISYNPSGDELFKTYLSANYAVCTDISDNNKYLAIGEVDYSGTIIKSNIKIISLLLAQSDPENSIVYTYESDIGEIITNIKYQDAETAICMFNKYIQKVTTSSNERLYDITSNDIFLDINLKDNIAILNKQSSGLFLYEYELKMKNTNNKSDSLYILNNDVPKTLIVSGNLIGLNFGNEVQIINSSGWLMKSYTANKEIQSLVLGDSIAGVVYKNRIEIINL